MIRLRLFGTVDLRADGERELGSVVLQPKRLALLAYLATSSRGNHRRDTLLGMFWPELDSERARGALNKAVHYLRRSLGEGVLISHGDEGLSLDRERLWCDVVAFNHALDAGCEADALNYYQGDLLRGFFLSDTPEFERWLDHEREQCRRRAVTAARALAGEAEAKGNLVGAVDWARRAFSIAGEDEAVLRELLTLLERAGDRGGAVRLYEAFAHRYAQDYELEPAAETQALIARIRDPAGPNDPPSPADGPGAGAAGRGPGSPEASPLAARAAPSTGRAATTAASHLAGAASAAPAQPAAGDLRNRRLRAPGWTAAVTGLLFVAAAYWYVARPVSAGDATQRVVIAPLVNRTGEAALDPIGNMAADWIIQGLAQTGLVDVVPFTATLKSNRYVGSLFDAGDTAEQAHTLALETGARIVVSGSYYLQGDSLYLHARIHDAVADKVLQAIEPISATRGTPLAAVEALRQQVMAGLAPHVDPRIGATAGITSRTPSYDAYREYAAGVDRFIASEWRAAIGYFSRAHELDSAYTLPLVHAAIAHSNLGDFAAVDSLALLVDRHADRLAEYDRQAITAARAWARGDYATSYRAARRVAELAPNTIPHAQVARELLMVNRPREALRVFRELDPHRGELRGWFPYWINLATAHHLLGRYRDELEVGRQATALFPENTAATFLQTRAFTALGRAGPALSLLEEQLARLGPGQQSALLMRQAALELDAHGHTEDARRLMSRSLAWYLDAPEDMQATPGFQRALGEALYLAGEYGRAEQVLAPLAAARSDDVGLQGRLGTLAALRGDRVEAERLAGRLAALERPYLLGAHTLWRARIAALLGDSDVAIDLVRDAYAQGRTEWIAPHTDPDLAPLRGHRRFQALLN